MKCLRCGNQVNSFFYKGERGIYCRKCVRFCDAGIIEDIDKQVDSEYFLPFELTDKQKQVSSQLASFVDQGYSVLLEAVCGAL